MDAQHAPLISLGLPAVPASAGVARRAVAPLGNSISPDALDRLTLLVSELVTNVILHVRTAATLRVWVGDNLLLVKVCDPSPGAPVVRPAHPDATGGRGLHLVEQLTRRWGIEYDPPGKCVWFELGTGTEVRLDDDVEFRLDAPELP